MRHTRETCVMPVNDAAFGFPTFFWHRNTAAIVATPRLAKFKSHFDAFPKVVGGQLVTS